MEHPKDNSTSTPNPKTTEELEKEEALESIMDVMRRMIEAERNSPEHTLESHAEMFREWKEKYHSTTNQNLASTIYSFSRSHKS